MDICISLNTILILALLTAMIICGVILYPLLLGTKRSKDGNLKMGFLTLWFKRIKSLLSGNANVDFDIDWNINGHIIKEEEDNK